MGRRFLLRSAGGAGLAAVLAPRVPSALAQELRFVRLGTGSTSGTYFPVGGLIATALSGPPGSRPCDRGGSCGVPGLIAVAQSTAGSIANVTAIQNGSMELGLSQSDVAFWAYGGVEIFSGQPPMSKLRSIANLYTEALHLVVRRDGGIRKPADLRGKRVSIDRPGSGTRADALVVLQAFGLGRSNLDMKELSPAGAAEAIISGELDAFFQVVGVPGALIEQLARENAITLVPLLGPEVETLLQVHPFFSSTTIPAGLYPNLPFVETLGIGAQLLVTADLETDLVQAMTAALWHPRSAQLFAEGHPRARALSRDRALDNLGVPLHPGAAAYYEAEGLEIPARSRPPIR